MLQVKNVSRTYLPKKGVPVKALDNVSIDFEETGLVFLLGKSGSGKSTLLNVIGGLDKMDAGEIIIKGKSSSEFTGSDFDSYRNTFIGFIFQEYNILNEFNVEKNIKLALELQGKKATQEIVDGILEEVDLEGYGKRKPTELSGGQKQRVAIARALIKEPEIIFADEPTGALDSATGIQVFDTLKKLSKTKLVVVVSHDREFAEQYGDRVIELKDGKIISDTIKKLTPPREVTEGFNIIGNNLIHVEKGHKITELEAEFLVERLQRTKDEIIISTSPKANDEFRRKARVDKDGNAEEFFDTKKEDVKLKNYNKNDLKLIRSRLKYLDSFKMGASSLKSKPVRLVFTIFLSMISFAMFGLVDTLGSYNKVTTAVSSIMDSNIKTLAFQKTEKENEDSFSYQSRNMTLEDIKKLEQETNTKLAPVFAGDESNYGIYNASSEFGFYNNLHENNTNMVDGENYYASGAKGCVVMTDERLSELGYTLLGTGARLASADNEVAITKYLFESFEKYGFKDSTASPEYIVKASDTVTYDKIIGHKLSIDNKNYTITAVVDTKFDSSRYDSLKLPTSNGFNISRRLLVEEFGCDISFSYTGMLLVSQDGFDKIVTNNSQRNTNFYINTNSTSYPSVGFANKFVELGDVTGSDILWIGAEKSALADNEIIISVNKLVNFCENQSGSYGAFAVNYNNTTIPVNVGEWASLPLEVRSEVGTAEDYRNALESTYYTVSPAEGIKCGYDQLLEQRRSVLDSYWNSLKGAFEGSKYTLDFSNSSENPNVDLSVVGVYIPYLKYCDIDTSDSYGSSQVVIASSSIVDLVESTKDAIFAFAIGDMPTTAAAVKTLVKYSYGQKGNIVFKMQNSVMLTLSSVNELIETISKVFFYIGLGFAVFASLMLMNFISTSISYKKREIGILRAVGARGSDVFGIFFNEALIIALVNFVLATISTIVVTVVLNGVLRNDYGLQITLLNFGIRQVALILAVSVFAAFISSILPVTRIAKKRPIDAINNR